MKNLLFTLFVAAFIFSNVYSQLNEPNTVEKWKCKSGDCKNGTGKLEGKFKIEDYDCLITLEGQFENGLIKSGTYVYDAGHYNVGFTYIGEFVNGKREGKGVWQEKSGNNLARKYEGEWKDGKMNGKGIMTLPTGEIWEGTWKDDVFVSADKISLTSGSTYIGEIKNEKRTGKGSIIYSNGSKYEGEVEDGQRSGNGHMIYSNLDEYEGKWKNDNRNGEGAMFWVNGDSYSGSWKSNNQNGLGEKKWVNGKSYSGEWKTNQMHGFGKYCVKKGDTISGYFYKDDYLSSQKADFELKLKDENAKFEQMEAQRQKFADDVYGKEEEAIAVVVNHKRYCVTYLLSAYQVNIFGGARSSVSAIFVEVPYAGKRPLPTVVMQYAEEARGFVPNGYKVVQTLVNENCDCQKVKAKVEQQVDLSEWVINHAKTIQ